MLILLRHHRVSVTPLKSDMTDSAVRDGLAQALGFGVSG